MLREPPRLVVILVEPRTPGNVGMVARAMRNFGVEELRLVNPCDHLAPEARKFAVEAAPLLEAARRYPDLGAALADCPWAVAATRRSGKRRGGSLLPVVEVPGLLASLGGEDRLALVFGREDCGLASDEVALCSHTATIPTPGSLGSLNLAQAVLLFLYEATRTPSPPARSAPRPGQAALDPLLHQVASVLDRVAFLNPHRPEHVLGPLRRIFIRGIGDDRDLALLRGIWSRIEDSVNDWRGRRRGDENRLKSG